MFPSSGLHAVGLATQSETCFLFTKYNACFKKHHCLLDNYARVHVRYRCIPEWRVSPDSDEYRKYVEQRVSLDFQSLRFRTEVELFRVRGWHGSPGSPHPPIQFSTPPVNSQKLPWRGLRLFNVPSFFACIQIFSTRASLGTKNMKVTKQWEQWGYWCLTRTRYCLTKMRLTREEAKRR